MGGAIQVSITLSGLGRLFGGRLEGVVETAAAAERAGVDQVALPDHLAIGPRTDRYPYGPFPLPSDEPWLEPFVALAAIAGATQRIRLATSVLVAPLRPALLLAKSAATLDVLSRGRLDLGVGVGWQRDELEGAGVPFAGRTARLDDALRACRLLWRGERVSYRSASVTFEDLVSLPRPVQRDGPPIWFGVAPTPENAARIAELGAGWMPIGSDLDQIARGVDRLRAALARAGRDPDSLGVRAHAPVAIGARGRADLERTLARLPEMGARGVTVAAFALGRFVRTHGDVEPFLARLGRRT